MSVIVRSVSRHFGDARALDGVSLQVERGEFVALLGPSGSGKTTLLRVLAGLEGTDAGSVQIDARDMTSVPARDRGVGVVFQHYALFRHMTVFENVAFGLRVRPPDRRPARADIAKRVRDLLALVQIPELESRYPDQISGGQRQRVALARALAIEPRLLLLDEPFGALDALVRKDVRRWVRRLHEELGLTTILVTHDQDEAMEMADRVAVMENGRIVQFAPPATLLAAPATPFVAGFVGEAARIACAVRQGVVHFDPLPLPPLRVMLPDGSAEAFVRPHDLVASPGDSAVLRGLRAGHGEARAIVEAGDANLDAVVHPLGPWARRGAPCRLHLRGAQVFGADGTSARAVPLAERAAVYG
ncbi:sulfate/molybdate ABC transporter ATP-binding protein [Falsiroseomonas sp. HW251]|uniref:sulfate/molybdate ABC transporter ATP-binding protein n=1 Tax=Falsiroseomonas sp. HW251 TaxID=3390998 RepID=UPI003D31CEE6